MTWARAMRAALLATAGQGQWWIAALAAFLVRGGLVALLPAIVLVPTPAELALHLGPSLTGDAPGDVTSVLVEIVLRLVVAATVILLVTTAIGVRIEGDLVAAAADEELEGSPGPLCLPLGRAIVARLVTHLPTLIVLVLGGVALTGVAYAELLSPSGSGSLAGRVVAGAPLAVIGIVVAWLVGETWGGLAVRRLAAGESLGGALARGLLGLVRPTGLATLALASLAVVVPAAALWLAASRAFDLLWPLVVDRADPWTVTIALLGLVVTWGAGLWLLGIGLAFRSAAWTAESLRQR